MITNNKTKNYLQPHITKGEKLQYSLPPPVSKKNSIALLQFFRKKTSYFFNKDK